MAGLAEAVQAAAGQPSSVRVGTVTSVNPVEISANGVAFEDVGVANWYTPRLGDSVILLGQSSGAGTDPASWLAIGSANPDGGPQTLSLIASRVANLSVGSALGTETPVPLDTETWDNYGIFAPTASDIVVPYMGVYRFVGRGRFATNATGIRIGTFYVNAVATNQEQVLIPNASVSTTVDVVIDLLLNAGDAVYFAVKQNSGAALNLTAAWVSMSLVSRM